MSFLYLTILYIKFQGVQMKAIIPTMKTLPAVQILELGQVILSHVSNMERIKREYQLNKLEMKQRFHVEIKSLEQDFQRFKKMAKLQKQYFEQGHTERMKMLKIAERIAKSLNKTTDVRMAEILNVTLGALLNEYGESRQKQVGYFGTPKQLEIGGDV